MESLDSECESLRVTESAGREGLMEGTKGTTIQIERNEVEGVCAVYGGAAI